MAFLPAVAELWIVLSALEMSSLGARPALEADEAQLGQPHEHHRPGRRRGDWSASVQPMADRLSDQAENLTAL
jgi:hypothetical protein